MLIITLLKKNEQHFVEKKQAKSNINELQYRNNRNEWKSYYAANLVDVKSEKSGKNRVVSSKYIITRNDHLLETATRSDTEP